MKTKIFVTFSLVLSFGLTFERSIETKSEKSQTSDQNSEEVSTDDAWNPLAELLGLKVPESREDQTGLSDLFQKHSMEMDRAMNDHQNMMDKAMQEHQGFLQSPLGDFDQQINQPKSAMDGHQKMMDTEMNHHFKDMSDFDKDWEQFDKDMSQMFKEFDSHMSQMSAPFEQPSEQLQPQKEEPPIAGTDEKLSDAWPKKVELMVKQKAQNETEKTGLPVFHPDKTDTEPIDQSSDPPTYQYYDQTSDQLPVFISNLLDSFKPVLSDLQKDAEERISTSQANTENKQQSETLTIEEGSESNDNSTEVDLLSQFVDSIANSATALGSLIFDGLNYDGNNTMIVTEDNGDGTHDVKLIPCQCPKAEFGQHMKDCPMLRMPMQMLRESPQNAKVNSTQDKMVKEWEEAMAKAEEEEERMSEADEDLKMKLKIAFILHALENELMARITHVREIGAIDDLDDLDNDKYTESDVLGAQERIFKTLNDNNVSRVDAIGIMWPRIPVEVSQIRSSDYSKREMLDRVTETVVNRILFILKRQSIVDENQKRRASAEKYIEKQLKREFIVRKEHDDYEWYEWTGLGVVASISLLLLIVALFICVERTRSSQTVKLDKEGNKTEGQNKTQNSVANENLSNKYKEKIKTIFVNFK